MGGSSAGGGTTNTGAAGRMARARTYDKIYGPGWQEATLKTLEQELRERGIEPRPGDEEIPVGLPDPPSRSPLGAAPWIAGCFVVAVLAILIYVIAWEAIPDAPGEFCPSPFERCVPR